jgi:uncharacterized protein
MLQIVIAGLLLPFRLIFKPYSFRDEVHTLAPDASEDYNLIQTRRYWKDKAFWRGMERLAIQWFIALVYPVMLAAFLQRLGYPLNWFDMALGIGVGIAVGIAVGVLGSVAWGVAGGVAVGVAGSVPGGVAWEVTWGVGGSVATNVAASVALGIAVGVTWGMMAGVMGAAWGKVVGIAWGRVVGIAGGMVVGIALGIDRDGVAGVAVAITSVLITTHLIFYPIQYAVAWRVGRGLRRAPHQAIHTWRWSPLVWDEVQWLPFPPLFHGLKHLYRTNQPQAEIILAEVAAHRYQNWLARWVRLDLAADDAAQVRSVHGLAALERSLDWLADDPDDDDDRNPALNALATIRVISGETRSALESDSPTNRVRRYAEALRSTDAALLNLSEPPGWRRRRERALIRKLRPALGQWRSILAAAHQEAQAEQQRLEPIPQVYVSDGKPILPAGRHEEDVPFKGRTALFRQLEQAVGGAGSERQTLLLYGQRRTGKTSILRQLTRRLGSRCIPVFLDVQGEQLSGASDASGVLEGIARFVRQDAQERSFSLPVLDAADLQRDPYPAFGRWLDQVEQSLDNRTLLLCFDEFEALEEAIEERRLDGRMLNMLRAIVQHRQRITVLLAGSHQLDELSPRWSSSLINTRLLPISFLERDDARELIVQPVSQFPAIYQPAAVERILAATACQPLLIQSLCAELVNLMNRERRQPPQSLVEIADVEVAVPVVFERSKAYFDDLWRSQTGGRTGQAILEQIAGTASNSLKVAHLRTLIDDQEAPREALALLLRREIIRQVNGTISITVPMVAQYIRHITTW